MFKHIFSLLIAASLLAVASLAASDPFEGKWKLDPARSKIADEMIVQSAGGGKYAFDFGAGTPETIVTDGTDQPGNFGTTLSVAVAAPDRWTVVRKQDGHTIIEAHWELSNNGNTLTDHFASVKPDGSASKVDFIYKRTAGTAGFVGTWESVGDQMSSSFELQVAPYERIGLSFVNSSEGSTRNLKFDQKDYPVTGSDVPKGFVTSGRRLNARALRLTDKFNGKVVDTQQVEISADLKTLTITERSAGPRKPKVFVFNRDQGAAAMMK